MDGDVTVVPDTTQLDLKTDDGKAKAKVRQANKAGYSDLLVTCSGNKAETAFHLVNQSRTKDLPNGCLRTAWKKLSERYEQKEAKDEKTY